MSNYIELRYLDLAIPALLILLNGGLSLWLRLGLERQLLISAFRMVVQLILVGYVLLFLFRVVSPAWTGFAAAAMILFAGREIVARQSRPISGLWAYGLGTGCMLFAAGAVTALALLTQLRPEPWYHPRYALPLLGMVLGNTMTGISLGLDVLTHGLQRSRAAVEAQLALGATRWNAMLPVTRDALRSGFMPIINAMAASGLVSLPGMMTGQILAGVEPTDAVKYQLLVMFLIAGGTGIGTLSAVVGGVYRLSDDRHRLRLDRLAPPHAPLRRRSRTTMQPET
jgi:putative ABC transport system permease protein